MQKQIIIEDERIVNSTDWEGKSKEVIARLDEELFNTLHPDDGYDITYDKFGNEIRKKRTVKKNEVMPIISPAQVTAKLNRFLRVYRPMGLAEATSLDDMEYLTAYGYYLDIISHINKYTTFLADKQTFSAFCNISTDVYNDLMVDPKYSQVFASIEDGFVHSNFTVAQAGLVDSKTTITKLTTKDAGHSLVKSPDSVVVNYTQKVDKQQVNMLLDKFDSMTKKIPSNLPRK